jgi:hypothetical protein
VTGRQGTRCRKLLDDLKKRIGYLHLKEETLDGTMWSAGFGRGFGPVVRQTSKRMNPHSSSTTAVTPDYYYRNEQLMLFLSLLRNLYVPVLC